MASKPEVDKLSGVETTGHDWDGLQELNNPLPKWWVYIFYACIVWSLIYYIFFPSWPLISSHLPGIWGWSARGEWTEVMKDVEKGRAPKVDKIKASSFDDIRKDPALLAFAVASGKSSFAQNCMQCHGPEGKGNRGYPRLGDDDWLWGGTTEAIFTTIQHGIRAVDDPDTRQSAMPRFGADGILTPAQINDVAEYVLTLSKQQADPAAAERGKTVFAENCVACHQEGGTGGRDFGAPALNDGIWLYGGDKGTLVETVTNARSGVMPSWNKRLDEPTIKMLTLYVHQLGGGE